MRILILAVLLVGSVSAGADYTNYGGGTFSCETWTEKRKTDEHFNYLQWVLGWVSASGYYVVAKTLGFNASGQLARTDMNAINGWLDNYCRENPLNLIEDAAKGLVRVLAIRAK